MKFIKTILGPSFNVGLLSLPPTWARKITCLNFVQGLLQFYDLSGDSLDGKEKGRTYLSLKKHRLRVS